MKALFQRLVRSSVAWTFFNTVLRLGSTLFVMPLILRKVPAEQIGLWYVFGTIGGFAGLLDLGFEPTITRMTSYVWGGASRIVGFGLHSEDDEGNSGPNRALLAELISTLRAYYLWLGLAVLVMLSVAGGIWIWIITEKLDGAASLRLAWFVYAAGCCLNFMSGRWPALLTGVGAVREAQHIGIISLIGYYVIAVSGLLLGYGFWAMVAGNFLSGILARFLGKRSFRRIAMEGERLPRPRMNMEILGAIWPSAWRMGIVMLGAFLIIQSNTLVASAYLGLKTTASYGLTFQVVRILVGISSVWVTVKMPTINQLRVKKAHMKIAHIFASRLRLMILTYAFGTASILYLAPIILRLIHSKTVLLPFNQILALAVIQFLECHHSLYSELVFTENYNPFIKSALGSGVSILLLSLILTPMIGVWGLLLSAGFVQACFNNWWPVLRAVRGLDLTVSKYFGTIFFNFRTSAEI